MWAHHWVTLSQALSEVFPVFGPWFPIQWEKLWSLHHRVGAKTK